MRWPYLLISGWALFTVSLAVWWVYFGIAQLDRVSALDFAARGEVVGHQKMLLWEGGALIVSLIAGACGLVVVTARERRERRRIEEFFGTFAHEMKTPLAGLRLQAEMLREELRDDHGSQSTLHRLLTSLSRLTLHLENSLVLASLHRAPIFLQRIDLRDIFESLREGLPELELTIEGDLIVEADRRMMESVAGNIVHNSVTHGKSSVLRVTGRRDGSFLYVSIRDNGRGFRGSEATIGELFSRHYPGSGSGLGLYLVRSLVKRLGGAVSFETSPPGFGVVLKLKGA